MMLSLESRAVEIPGAQCARAENLHNPLLTRALSNRELSGRVAPHFKAGATDEPPKRSAASTAQAA
jgi:hypothetical protein